MDELLRMYSWKRQWSISFFVLRGYLVKKTNLYISFFIPFFSSSCVITSFFSLDFSSSIASPSRLPVRLWLLLEVSPTLPPLLLLDSEDPKKLLDPLFRLLFLFPTP